MSLEQVKALNARVEELNTQRNKAIGRKEELEKQIQAGLKEYNARYGTNLTVEGIQAEFDKVSQDVEKQAELLGNVIQCIDNGDIKGAENLLGVQSVGTGVGGSPVAEAPVAKEVEQPIGSVPHVPETPVVEASVMESPKPPVPKAPVKAEVPVPPVAPPSGITQAQSKVTSNPDIPDVFKQSFKPAEEKPMTGNVGAPPMYQDDFMTGVTQPPATDAVTPPVEKSTGDGVSPAKPPSFDSILNGSNFTS